MLVHKQDLYQFDMYYFDTYDSTISTDVAYILSRILSNEFIFFDIGANVGWYSLFASKLMPQGTIYAVEPIPETYKALRYNVQLNNATNIIPLSYAITDQSGTVLMEYTLQNSGFSHLKTDGTSYQDTIPVESITLDELTSHLGINPNVIKIDCEGAEPLILAGGKSTLTHKELQYLIIEINSSTLHRLKHSANNLISLLHDYGFLVMSINPDGTLSDELPLHKDYFNVLACKSHALNKIR